MANQLIVLLLYNLPYECVYCTDTKINMNLCIKTEPVTEVAHATINVWLLLTYFWYRKYTHTDAFASTVTGSVFMQGVIFGTVCHVSNNVSRTWIKGQTHLLGPYMSCGGRNNYLLNKEENGYFCV